MQGTPYPTCRQVNASGHLCGSPALRGKIFCFHHQRDRQRRENIRRGLGVKFRNGQADFDAEVINSLDLPAPDDPVAVGVCLSNTFLALASGLIPTKRAALMLYNLQIISSNFAALAKYKKEMETSAAKAAREEEALDGTTEVAPLPRAVVDPEPVAALDSPHHQADYLFSEKDYEQRLATDEPPETAFDAKTIAHLADAERLAGFSAHPKGELPLPDIAPLEPEQIEATMQRMGDEDWERFCDKLWISAEEKKGLKEKVLSQGDRAQRDAARRLLRKYNPRAVEQLEKTG